MTKDSKLYKTSTQKQAFRPHGYTLGSLNEYEVPVKNIKDKKKKMMIKIRIYIKK